MLTGILQPTHLIIILAVALLVLGPKRLPDAGRALGQGLKEFRSSLGGVQDEPPQRLGSASASASAESEKTPGGGHASTSRLTESLDGGSRLSPDPEGSGARSR